MNLQRSKRLSTIYRFVLLLCMTLAVLLGTSAARAGFIVSVESVNAVAGSTGNTLEVDLSNTGASAVIGAFSFGISTSTANIDFTQATINTTNYAYIFAGASLFGPIISTTTGQFLDASDLSTLTLNTPPTGTTLGANQTLGLALVSFDVAAGTSAGSIAVDVTSYPTTSLTDPSGNDISGTNGSNLSFSNGTITILTPPSGSPTSEPSTLLLLSAGLVLLAARAIGCRCWRFIAPAR
jgi:hypothetical protein